MDNNNPDDNGAFAVGNALSALIWVPIFCWLSCLDFYFVPSPWHLPALVTIFCGCLLGWAYTAVYFHGKLNK